MLSRTLNRSNVVLAMAMAGEKERDFGTWEQLWLVVAEADLTNN